MNVDNQATNIPLATIGLGGGFRDNSQEQCLNVPELRAQNHSLEGFDHNTAQTLGDEHFGHGQEFSLKRADGGIDAWLFLASAIVMEMLVWGFPFAYGVFQEYYSSHAPFAGSRNIAVVGSCAMGIMYLSSPLVFAILERWPRYQRWSTPSGIVVMCVALAMSSFSRNTNQLIATQGVLYAIGGGFAYSPCILFLDEWFVRRKGFAYGVMWTGTGLAGVVVPILMQWLLNTWGYQVALRAWGVVLFVTTAPLLIFLKPRVPLAQKHTIRRFDFSWILTPTFGILQACNIIEALGFFLPTIYLPTYARSIGASSFGSTLTVILFNVASTLGSVTMGWATDQLHVVTCILISTIGSTLGVFVLWGFSTTLTPLYAFCVVYGLFAGSFTSTWPGIMQEVKKRKAGANPLMIFSLLAAGRGVGNVVSGPLSEALIRAQSWKGQAGFAYGSGFGPLIVFTGVTACLGGASVFGRRPGWV